MSASTKLELYACSEEDREVAKKSMLLKRGKTQVVPAGRQLAPRDNSRRMPGWAPGNYAPGYTAQAGMAPCRAEPQRGRETRADVCSNFENAVCCSFQAVQRSKTHSVQASTMANYSRIPVVVRFFPNVV